MRLLQKKYTAVRKEADRRQYEAAAKEIHSGVKRSSQQYAAVAKCMGSIAAVRLRILQEAGECCT